jgi:Flp pilus assembly CpaE family ATPase
VTKPVLTAADGAPWEARLIGHAEAPGASFSVVRRCVDVVDLLAAAALGQAVVAVVDARLRRLDSAAIDRLAGLGVAVVAVLAGADANEAEQLRSAGIRHAVPADAGLDVFASVIDLAAGDLEGELGNDRGFANPSSANGSLGRAWPGPADDSDAAAGEPAAVAARRGSVIAVWGPAGAPGRTTVAVGLADEVSRLGRQTLLIDADVYGGVIAAVLGLLDESPGLASACRQAQTRQLDPTVLAALAWQLNPHLRVLTGISRPDRWPELRTAAVVSVLEVAREFNEFTVVDLGFCLETDEELSFDTLAPRRNGATLAALDNADLVVVVGSADPVGVQRLVRGLAELDDAGVRAPRWVVFNRVRRGPVPGDPAKELQAALQRFTGHQTAGCLPFDLDSLDNAIASGRTLAETSPSSPLRRALGELAQSIAGAPAAGGSQRRRRSR